MAIDCGANWRFLSLGDSGIRINGARVLKHEKLIDSISTEVRVSIFKILAEKFNDPDEHELMTRQAIFSAWPKLNLGAFSVKTSLKCLLKKLLAI
jgi:hypothetical protein